MKSLFIALIVASVAASGFNTNDYDVDINGNIFKKAKVAKELSDQDIKKYK